jgi:hypothetical protein
MRAFLVNGGGQSNCLRPKVTVNGPVHSAYNPSFSACFFSWNNIFLSQQISQQCFSAGLSAQPNGSNDDLQRWLFCPSQLIG